MKFNTPYLRKRSAPEKNSGEDLLELAGYEPINHKIKRMMEAGERLSLGRFDYDPGFNPDDAIIDETRSGSFDLVDATNKLREIERRKAERKKTQEVIAEDESKEIDSLPEKGNDNLPEKGNDTLKKV